MPTPTPTRLKNTKNKDKEIDQHEIDVDQIPLKPIKKQVQSMTKSAKPTIPRNVNKDKTNYSNISEDSGVNPNPMNFKVVKHNPHIKEHHNIISSSQLQEQEQEQGQLQGQ